MGLILISSILFVLSYASPLFPQGIQGLSSLSLVPAFFALYTCNSIKKASAYGSLWAILTSLGIYYWFKNYGEYALTIILSVSLGYAMEYFTLFTILWIILKRANVFYRPLILTCIWTAYEYIKSIGFLAFPWGLLAHSIHQITPLAMFAQYFGTWGISFILAYINSLIFEYLVYVCSTSRPNFVLLHTTPRTYKCGSTSPKVVKTYLLSHSICVGILLLMAISFGSISLKHQRSLTPNSYLRVLLIQQNLDSWADASPEESIHNLIKITDEALQDISEKHNNEKPDLIVWSETSLLIPFQLEDFSYANKFYNENPKPESFIKFLRRIDTPLLAGTSWYTPDNTDIAYNAAVIINPDGKISGFYGKNQLVPFAENFPFMEHDRFRNLMKNVFGISGSWTPYGSFNTLTVQFARKQRNTDNDNLYTGELKIGIPICFEDSFSYVTRNFALQGAQLLVNLTNVSWSKSPVTAYQQIISAKFRSIETGLTSVRATNSGLTSYITPDGIIQRSIPTFTKAYLYDTIPLYYSKNTLYLLTGDAFAKLLRFVAVFTSLYFIVSYLKSQKKFTFLN